MLAHETGGDIVVRQIVYCGGSGRLGGGSWLGGVHGFGMLKLC